MGCELDVGLKGAFLCSKVFGNTMANELGGGIILNIASDLSVIALIKDLQKGGIDGVNKTLSQLPILL